MTAFLHAMGTIFSEDGDGGLWIEQDAGEDIDRTIDWSPDLGAGDTISDSVWVADAGLVADRTSFDATTATAWLSGGLGGKWYRVSNKITTAAGRVHVRGFRLLVRGVDTGGLALSVFSDIGAEVAGLRRDRLAAAAATWAPGVSFSDELLAGKLATAEREIERSLRVFLTPREMVADGTPQAEVDALVAAGHRVEFEPGYDYEPRLFSGSAWGAIETRHRPLIKVHGVEFHYPVGGTIFEIKPEWMRVDRKYGRVQFVPYGAFQAGQLGGLVSGAIGGGIGMPLMIRLRYRAGLENVARDWPDILSAIRRKAVLGVLDELYLPSSGAVSGDGLMQSFTMKLEEHRTALHKAVERIRQAIGGVEMAVL